MRTIIRLIVLYGRLRFVMKKNLFKKTVYIIPLIAGIFVMYGALSGNLQKEIYSVKDKYEEIVLINKKDNNNETEKEIPTGKINLYEWFDNWSMKPSVETYDPENKIGFNDVYGMTYEEYSYRNEMYREQDKITSFMDIPSEYRGSGILNKEKILDWDTYFKIKFNQATYEYSNLVIRDDFNGLDSDYYNEEKYKLLSMLDENEKLTGATMVNWETDEIITDVECKLLMFDITITPQSDWVTEAVSVPELKFLKAKGDALEYFYKYYTKHSELNIVAEYPIYYDLGLYDAETAGVDENIYVCPMRKGEVIKFRVGYIVPLELINYAYFVFNPNCYTATDFSYATDDIAIFKVTEGQYCK